MMKISGALKFSEWDSGMVVISLARLDGREGARLGLGLGREFWNENPIFEDLGTL
jgi:hypothetical protein